MKIRAGRSAGAFVDHLLICGVQVRFLCGSPLFHQHSDPKRNLFNQRFSPDQRWITFPAHDLMYNSTSTVYVVPAAGGEWRAMTNGAAFDDKPRWGSDGGVLYLRIQ